MDAVSWSEAEMNNSNEKIVVASVQEKQNKIHKSSWHFRFLNICVISRSFWLVYSSVAAGNIPYIISRTN